MQVVQGVWPLGESAPLFLAQNERRQLHRYSRMDAYPAAVEGQRPYLFCTALRIFTRISSRFGCISCSAVGNSYISLKNIVVPETVLGHFGNLCVDFGCFICYALGGADRRVKWLSVASPALELQQGRDTHHIQILSKIEQKNNIVKIFWMFA